MHYQGLYENKFHVHSSDWDKANPHRHGFLELLFVAKGTIDHHINGITERIGTGGYLIVDLGEVHSLERVSEEPIYITNFLFLPEFLDRTLAGKKRFDDILESFLLKFSYKTLKESMTGKAFYDTDGSVSEIVNDIVREYEQKNYGYLEWIRCQFTKLLIATMRNIGKKENTARYNKLITDITDQVNARYSEKLKLNDIAKELGYSATYLSAQFSKSTGQRFSDYVKNVRIEHACKILENANMAIPDIAHAVGISDIKFFNKIFKQQIGIPPSQFRKLYK